MVIAFKYKVRILPRLDKHTHLHTHSTYIQNNINNKMRMFTNSSQTIQKKKEVLFSRKRNKTEIFTCKTVLI